MHAAMLDAHVKDTGWSVLGSSSSSSSSSWGLTQEADKQYENHSHKCAISNPSVGEPMDCILMKWPRLRPNKGVHFLSILVIQLLLGGCRWYAYSDYLVSMCHPGLCRHSDIFYHLTLTYYNPCAATLQDQLATILSTTLPSLHWLAATLLVG